MTSHVTTHVLDAVLGTPAPGIEVSLSQFTIAGHREVATSRTDADGRIRDLGPEKLEPGTYRLVFDTGAYFSAQGRDHFYPQVTIDFRIEEGQAHYHVPILLSPYAYSTYRGS